MKEEGEGQRRYVRERRDVGRRRKCEKRRDESELKEENDVWKWMREMEGIREKKREGRGKGKDK